MSKLEVIDEKAPIRQAEEGEKKQKTVQEIINEAEALTQSKLQRLTELKEQDVRLQKDINEAQQNYIKAREELFGIQLRYLQSVNQGLATQLSKYEKPQAASSAPAGK